MLSKAVFCLLLGVSGACAASRPFFFPRGDGSYLAQSAQWDAAFGERTVELRLRGNTFQVEFEGARRGVLPQAAKPFPGRINRFLGSDPEAWKTGITAYSEIVYRELYPGIDLSYGESSRQLKSEFHLAPGADPNLIRMRFNGPVRLRHGALLVRVRDAILREEPPEVYQEIEGRRTPVQASYVIRQGRVGFRLAAYRRDLPLVIDPVISFATLLGGSGTEAGNAVAADHQGGVLLAGYSDSSNLPIRNGRSFGGNVDAFVARWDAAGNLVYCTYLGGSGDDRAMALAVDSAGNAYVTGYTASSNFPTVTPYQSANAGYRDIFISKLNPAGALVYSTYLGGLNGETGNAIAVDAAGAIYVAGETSSTNFPTVNAFQSSNHGQLDAFACKLTPSTNTLAYSTYLGGEGDDRARGLAVDAAGASYLTGVTSSFTFPRSGALQNALGGAQDAFVSKISPAGNVLVYSTYLGGSGGGVGNPESGNGIAVDTAGNAYVTGSTPSRDFPVVNAGQPGLAANGASDAFVAKLNPSGSALVFSTYFGGPGLDYGNAIALDSLGGIYIAGYTAANDLPLTQAVQSTNGGGYDAFVAQFDTNGQRVMSTFYGGAASDAANSISVSDPGVIFVGGQTLSTNFPLKNPAQAVNGGVYDAFVVKLTPLATPAQYNGSHDIQGCSAVGGWAVNAADPSAAINVSIYDGSTLLTTVTANAMRSDLGSVASPYHGFSYTLPSSVWNNQLHTFSVKFPDGSLLPGSPRTITCNGQFGYHDGSSCSAVSGWAWDRSQPNTPLALNVFDGATFIGAITAGSFRSDLQGAGMGDGNHGFYYNLPGSVLDDKTHTFSVRFQNGQDLLMTRQSVTCSRPFGYVDHVSCSAIDGWAADFNQVNTPVSVDILDGATVLDTIQASAYRSDLAGGGMGNGNHSYTWPLPLSLKNGLPHNLRVRFTRGGQELISSGQSVTCWALAGYNDSTSCQAVAGWAWDANQPSTPVNLEIFDNGALIATVLANSYRGDLAAAGLGDGRHGFSYPLSTAYHDGRNHTFKVRFPSSRVDITNTSQTVTCKGIEGYPDAVSCSLIAGWAWDGNIPDTAITLGLYDGATLLQTIPASIYRQDLVNAGKGNGAHGFNIATPASLKDGKPHTVDLRYSATGQSLNFMPRTLTCP